MLQPNQLNRLLSIETASSLFNINQGILDPFSSSPDRFIAVGSTLFFTANDGAHGYELWKTDGTPSGTVLVKDIRDGPDDAFAPFFTSFADPAERHPQWANVGGILYFRANDGTSGFELWRSNGTAEGTFRVADIGPGANGASLHSFTNVDGTLFFSANDGVAGSELWKSDGSTLGTVLVRDIVPIRSYGSEPSWLTNVNGTLYFRGGSNYFHRSAVWRSDGTEAGTQIVPGGEFNGQGAVLESLVNADGALYFVAGATTDAAELWRVSPSGGQAELVVDLRPGSLGSKPHKLTAIGSTVYFIADCLNDGSKTLAFRRIL